jgi:hypothetical protein
MKCNKSNAGPNALRFGAYTSLGWLPGENREEFDTYITNIMLELSPHGPCEEEIVYAIACLMWRKGNIVTLRKAELAKKHLSDVVASKAAEATSASNSPTEQPDAKAIVRSAEKSVRKELGDLYDLIEVGHASSLDGLAEDLTIEAKFDEVIDKKLKRLLHLRGIKSMSRPVGQLLDVKPSQPRALAGAS